MSSASARTLAGEIGVAAALVVMFSAASAAGLAWEWRLTSLPDSDPFDGPTVAVVVAVAMSVLALPLGIVEGLGRRAMHITVKRWVVVGVAAAVVAPLIAQDRLVPRSYVWSDPAVFSSTVLWATAATGTAIISAILAPLIWTRPTKPVMAA